MSRLLISTCVSTVGLALVPGVSAAQAPAVPTAPATITTVGTATVKPEPANRRSNASIAKAVRDAQERVLPRSISDARRRAQSLADAAGVSLGTLQTISDVPPSPFGPYGNYGTEGTFGPGRFCGTVGRFRTRRLANGRTRRVRIGTRRTCRVPARVSGTVSLTFTVTPQT